MTKKARDPETQAFLTALGTTIRDLRRAKGLHQEQLGARCGIPGSRIGEIERGVVNASVARIDAVAGALGTSTKALMQRVEATARDDKATATVRAQLVAAVKRLDVHDLDLVAALVERLTRR